MEHDTNEETTVREQHFFREGNAEVLRLVTRGQVEDNASHQPPHPHRPPTLIVDGKDIILQRFIEDQKSRHELSMQDIEAARSMESHQRSKDVCNQQQPEIILIPERLELGHRQHVEEIGPNVQRLVIDHDRDYDSRKGKEPRAMRETMRQEKQEAGSIGDRPTLIVAKEQSDNAQYPFHDLELARQNVLLTRLLLEKENRRAGVMDSTSYLETQSLPGQVAIATQTDRTAATQTDRHVKSRSDNDESDTEESRYRKRLRSRKKYGGDGDWRRSRTLWMKSPIEEEGSPCFDKRLSILRKKVREVKEGRKISLEPDVLREISDSLDGNGSSCKGEEDETMRSYRKSTEQTSISYKILNEKENGSSEERRKEKSSEEMTDDRRRANNATESSSPEIKVQRERHVGPKEKSPKRETRSKAQKSEGVIKPSFRILEKEFTMLTKRLSKLGDKKFQESTASDSTCQEKSDSLAKETRKDSDQKSLKKMDPSTSQKHETASKVEQKGKQRKDSAIAKTKQKLKYQQSQVMSTGSSELDDSLGFDKPKKPSVVTRHETTKQKQSVGNHGKVKRLIQQMDRRESRKQVPEVSKDEETEKRKDGLSKGTPKGELKSEKVGKVAAKAPKLSVASRKQNVIEETSTSTEERREEKERDAFAFEKKSSTDFSERDFSNGLFQLGRERVEKKIIQKFSDDFVEREDTSEQKVTTSTEEEKDTASTEERKVGMLESNGIRKSQDLFDKSTKEQEERVISSRKDDRSAHLHTEEQLITDIKFIDMGPTKKEELGKIVVRDQKVDKMASKVEPTKIHGSMKPENESIKYSEEGRIKETKRVDELVSKSEKEIIERVRDKLEDYMRKDKPSNGFREQIETKLDIRIEEPKQEEDRELNDTYKYLKEEIEKMSEDLKKKRDESKRTEEEEEEEDVLSRYVHDIEDKNGAKQKAEKRIQVEVHVPTKKEHDGKMDAMQKMEKDIKSQVLSNGKDSMKFDTTDVHIEDKSEEEKQKVKLDISTTDHISEKEDSTKIAFNGDDKEKISLSVEIPHKEETTSIIETDKRIEENIFLDDRETDDKEKEDIKIKLDNRIIESSEDKKISDEQKVIVKSTEEDYGETTKDYKIAEEISEDKKIDIEEMIKDQKIDAETIVDYEVTEETAKDQKIDKEEMKDRKFEGETSIDHKITEEESEDSKIDEKQATLDRALTMEKIKDQEEDYKIVEEASMDRKIIGEGTKDEIIDKESIEKHKIPEEAIVKIIEEIPKDQKIKDDTMEDDSIIEKATVSRIEEISKDQVVKEISEDYEIAEKATEDFKITEEVTVDHKMEEKVKEDYTIVGERFDDDKSLIKTDFTTKEEISDKEQDSTEIDNDRISREESIFLDKKKDFDEKTFAKKIATDDHEISTKKVSDTEEEIEKKKSISPEIKEILPVVEIVTELIKSDDEKISDKEDIFTDKEEEIPIEEKKEIPKTDEIEKESISDDKDKKEDSDKKEKVITEETDGRSFKETIKEIQITDDHKIIEKEILETKEIMDDHQISDKEIVPATLEIEEIPIAEKQDDIQIHHIEKEDGKISHVDKDDEIKEKEDLSKISTTEEISMEVPIVPSIDINVKQETSTDTESIEDHASKKDNVFSEMFKAVHSLVDKLTNGKRSRKTSVEEVAITEFHSDDKIIQKEVLPPDDDKEKHQEESSITSESPASRVDNDSIKLMEEQMDDKNIIKDKSLDTTDEKVAISPEETDKSMQIDVVSDSKKTESDESLGIDKSPKEKEDEEETIKLILEKPLLEEVEIDKPLKHDPASLMQPADEKMKDSKDIVDEILSKKTIEISEESKEAIPDNEKMDVEPNVRIGEEELSLVPTSSEASASFQEIESPRSCSQTCETTTKEKLVSDSIISETSTDSAKTLEFEKQLKSAESKQIELQEMEQFVEGESFIAGGGIQRERATFPEGQSRESAESDVHTIVYRDESDKREDRTKEEMDKTLKGRVEEEGRIPVEEEYVSLPLFTSIIDTMDDSEDSDSSSDISRKTTLTTRPYQTPRNRARQVPESESSQTEEVAETASVGDEEQAILAVEVIGNGNVDSPKDERMLEKVEDAGMERAPSTRSTDEAVEGEETGSREEFINVQPCFSGGERLRTTSDTEIESSTKHTKDAKSETKRGKDGKINREDEASSSSGSKLAKTDTFKVGDKKAKEQDRKRVPPQRKKKTCPEESPGEEKTTHSQDAADHRGGYRARGKPSEDRSRQKDGDKTKQGRRREEESEKQRQFASRLRIEKDKKSSSSVGEKYPTPSRSGEIDTSRAQPKYMAWYKKNREEMEKRRAELMATDDEEQLPRWLRRSMRGQRAEKEDKKQPSQSKTADTTPRTRRKVKPLVNVESEQLKAIVRQGRKLRRAEGGRNEDPPVQIFATTPPHDPKHHLTQHSEYKYEKAPAPFYLHPPPPPHPSPQLSPEHFEIPPTMERGRTDEEFDSGIAVSLQAGNRRHQQLLEKKSVFDIAYSEAAPSQLRSDSTTPPS